ncbi:hypothetical protein [Methanosarcina siciliae]|uniref:hypothetical protein n=1 Tax=Methanosarcina siciliae TaxID=38027 RepID=UPI000B13F23D|nr:hypothetical protein [Methanosarcina siciliae]
MKPNNILINMSDKSPYLGIPTYGVIFLVSAFIVMAQHFSDVSFGAFGILAWFVVIVGVIGFAGYVLNQ